VIFNRKFILIFISCFSCFQASFFMNRNQPVMTIEEFKKCVIKDLKDGHAVDLGDIFGRLLASTGDYSRKFLKTLFKKCFLKKLICRDQDLEIIDVFRDYRRVLGEYKEEFKDCRQGLRDNIGKIERLYVYLIEKGIIEVRELL